MGNTSSSGSDASSSYFSLSSKKPTAVRDMLGSTNDQNMTAAQQKLGSLQTQISVEVNLFVEQITSEERLRDAALAANNKVVAKVHWERARSVKPKLAAAQQALSVITAQQQALYQQHLNVETMSVLKMSSAMMARGGSNKVESTISLVDAVSDGQEAENDVANALAGAKLSNVSVALEDDDEEWNLFLQQNAGGGAEGVESKTSSTPMVAPPYMPDVPVESTQQSLGLDAAAAVPVEASEALCQKVAL